jgi:hypothetical protein
MLTRFWLRVGGLALLFWCLYRIREDLLVYWLTAINGNWQFWANTLPSVWHLPLGSQFTYARIWWIVCFAGSVYLIGWNAGAARLLWRGLWVGAGKCPKCGYDRSGLAAGRACPECGIT